MNCFCTILVSKFPKGSLHKKKPEIYWSFANRGVHPPPFRRIGNFRFFPRLFSFFFRNFKMIIYAPWNRYCMIQRTRLWSTGLSTLKEEEKKAYIWTFGSVNNTMKYIVHQFSKIWSYLQKYYTNNGILCVKRVENLLSGGREPNNFGSGGHTSIRGVWSPNSHPLILDSPARQSKLWPVVQFSQLPPINGEREGGEGGGS